MLWGGRDRAFPNTCIWLLATPMLMNKLRKCDGNRIQQFIRLRISRSTDVPTSVKISSLKLILNLPNILGILYVLKWYLTIFYPSLVADAVFKDSDHHEVVHRSMPGGSGSLGEADMFYLLVVGVGGVLLAANISFVVCFILCRYHNHQTCLNGLFLFTAGLSYK